ncbi:MAG: hypothetical protein LUQ38_01245 [Methanotrichaceae archaeon]|nr:hypothetical protein [Methanotrichaceae archaeon]
MTYKHNMGKIGIFLIGLCIVTSLINSVQAVDVVKASDKENLGLSSSGPDCAYCTSSGYFCMNKPGINSGKPICQFPNGDWCDAHAYFIENCSSPSTPLNPYGFYNNPQGALDIADATKTCNKYGGQVESMHTPYGDSNICIFPNGQAIDLPGLNSLTSLQRRVQEDVIWRMEAYNFLNAP